ncbi:hypothetical protein HK102_009243, partial [Quaeritorhiza haematococci]
KTDLRKKAAASNFRIVGKELQEPDDKPDQNSDAKREKTHGSSGSNGGDDDNDQTLKRKDSDVVEVQPVGEVKGEACVERCGQRIAKSESGVGEVGGVGEMVPERRTRRKLGKKISIEIFRGRRGARTPNPAPGTVSTTAVASATVPTSSSPPPSLPFDGRFNYRRRLKHLTPQYNTIKLTAMNAIQILVLLVEFLQLASFPYRDLLRSPAFQEALLLSKSLRPQNAPSPPSETFINLLRKTVTLFSSWLPEIDTIFLASLQFVVSWWVTVVGVVLAVVGVSMHYALRKEKVVEWLQKPGMRRVRKVLPRVAGGEWVIAFLPLANLTYLLVLGSFIEPLSCISDHETPLWPPENWESQALASLMRETRCYPVYKGNPPVQVWSSLVGFTMAYTLLTVFRLVG